MRRDWSKTQKLWGVERSAGHCWTCGDDITLFGNRHMLELIEGQGRTKENIVAVCATCRQQINCARRLTESDNVMPEFRLLLMRHQYDPIITKKEIAVVAAHGSKVHFVFHWFWFERPEGKRVIESVESRLRARPEGVTHM